MLRRATFNPQTITIPAGDTFEHRFVPTWEPRMEGGRIARFCGHDDCFVSGEMIGRCSKKKNIPPRYIATRLSFEPEAQWYAAPTLLFAEDAFDAAVLADVEVDGVSMRSASAGATCPCPCGSGEPWRSCHGDAEGHDPDDDFRLWRFSQLRLGVDYRLPAAYVMTLRISNPTGEDVSVVMRTAGFFWYRWWMEKDERLETCVQDLMLLKQDVDKNLKPSRAPVFT